MSALFCRVELNKTDGIVITLDNKDGSITHTIVLSGDDITTISKGDAGTSTIVQAPDKITMDCKTFELTAETITCSASSTAEFNSGSDFSINSDANLNAKAAMDVSVDGTNINLTGTAQISGSAPLIKLQ
ncbi:MULTISPECIES: hypothetical protein [unclassified Colwellia]|jgi:hypothetical protein|uniref:hypothetical protein n=1 Tax=unclassified Colwellia TaxID=196834 RepID=UPI0015F47557|nr:MULTISPECIES: hypothetical protein [unclassified Colwellia]MBA6232792.1 hypothetical protein [Colwellia sp. MB02u-7]MBA6236115.1 hypothetical protein [Colwellia sp. MB02u-11]MBA6256631.1 hypothetical protein [Colwellia sp. MB3u-28]MBA6261346.1 hypothetical protein [Colwellia sp. MB3u-41]MBA6298480.1 hypothetical protein [Colwellia sp. MB3u-22]